VGEGEVEEETLGVELGEEGPDDGAILRGGGGRWWWWW